MPGEIKHGIECSQFEALLSEALDAGVGGVLDKEAPLEDLVRAINIVAEGGTYLDPTAAAALSVMTRVTRPKSIARPSARGTDAVAMSLVETLTKPCVAHPDSRSRWSIAGVRSRTSVRIEHVIAARCQRRSPALSSVPNGWLKTMTT